MRLPLCLGGGEGEDEIPSGLRLGQETGGMGDGQGPMISCPDKGYRHRGRHRHRLGTRRHPSSCETK